MNLPNKITISRIIISILIMIGLLIPWRALGVVVPVYDSFFGLNLAEPISLKYIIAGALFIIAAVSDKIDGDLARKNNQVTDFGKMLDAIADKILVNGILIILAYERMIPLVVPVVIVTRDIIVDTCKMISGNKGKVIAASWMGKLKTAFMMIGLSFTFFGNFPFCLINFKFSELCLIIATILSVVSGCDYYFKTSKIFKTK